MSINKRILELINSKENGKRILFAKKTNKSTQQVSNMLKEGSSVGMGIATEILIAYPDLNADWLLTGEGEMLKKEEKASVASEPQASYDVKKESVTIESLTTALNNISEAIRLHAISDERNSRNMERMLDLITEKKGENGGYRRAQ